MHPILLTVATVWALAGTAGALAQGTAGTPGPAAPPSAAAAQPTPASEGTVAGQAGVVKRVSGMVQLQRGQQTLSATVGLAVQVGDVLRTGPTGTVAVTLADDTLLSAGPDSELVLSQFSFNPTTHEGGMLLSLWRGVLSVVTGLVAKKSPEKVNVQTRTVVLGVRGTEFIVDVSGATR